MTTFEMFLSILLGVGGTILVMRYPKLKNLMLLWLSYLFLRNDIKKFFDKD
tara:strand:- start:653 stop:805 length:153 start_codon:yes stop_codon:yes gene_type:complete